MYSLAVCIRLQWFICVIFCERVIFVIDAKSSSVSSDRPSSRDYRSSGGGSGPSTPAGTASGKVQDDPFKEESNRSKSAPGSKTSAVTVAEKRTGSSRDDRRSQQQSYSGGGGGRYRQDN